MLEMPEIAAARRKIVESRLTLAFLLAPLGAALASAAFIQIIANCLQLSSNEHIHPVSGIDIVSVAYFIISFAANIALYFTFGLVNPFNLSAITAFAGAILTAIALTLACLWPSGAFIWVSAAIAVLLEVALFCLLAGIPLLPSRRNPSGRIARSSSTPRGDGPAQLG